jgi:hypothetical protein
MMNPKTGLHERFTAALLNGPGFPHQGSGMFRPSEASVTIQTQAGPLTRGACKRRTWFRLKGINVTEGESLPHQIQRMNVGKEVENSIIEVCKREGLYAASSVPFRVTMDGIPIAGEIDAILRTEPCGGQKYIVEVKSIYGYYAQKTIFGKFLGNNREVGEPKDSYIMQIALYLNYFSRLSKNDPSYIPYGAIFICDRGDGHFGVFDVWLEEELKVIGDDEVIPCHKIYYSSDVMKVPRTLVPYTVEDILAGYRIVQKALPGNEPPPRDFCKEYTKDQVIAYHNAGKIADSAFTKWMSSHGPRGKGKEKLGDWNCQRSYCPWSSYCWPGNEEDKEQLDETENT